MEKVKIIKIPAGKMIKTPDFDPGSADFVSIMNQLFTNVVGRHEDIFQRVFMLWNDDPVKGFWLYSVMGIDIEKFDTSGFEVIDFEGGYYATATAIDPDDRKNDESIVETYQEIIDWVNQSKFFELDFDMKRNRCFMSQMPLGDKAKGAMDYAQLEIFIPIKSKK
jgi:predicted transcriptional regulator YdeE